MYCDQHAEDGMVNVRPRRSCSYDSSNRGPSFSIEGKTAKYCKKHAEEDVVAIGIKHCSHDSCTRTPSLNIKGSTKPAYCKQHAEEDMVNVGSRCCSHDCCTRRPSFNTKGI